MICNLPGTVPVRCSACDCESENTLVSPVAAMRLMTLTVAQRGTIVVHTVAVDLVDQDIP